MPTPNKVRAPGYEPEPFFYLDHCPDYVRWVAWSPDAEQMSALFWHVLQGFPDSVDVLIKVRRETPDEDSDPWQRFMGSVPRPRFQDAIGDRIQFIFCQGYTFQLCVKMPDQSDNFALDEGGVLFVYSDNEKYRSLCCDLGFEEQRVPLIFESDGCEFRQFPDAEEQLTEFITELGLQAVD